MFNRNNPRKRKKTQDSSDKQQIDPALNDIRFTAVDEDYIEFIKYLYYEYLERRFARIRNAVSQANLQQTLQELIKAARALRFIESNVGDDDNVSSVLTSEVQREILQSIQNGIDVNTQFFADSGIADIIQEYFIAIIDGLKVDVLPDEDLEVLRQSGSSSPRGELAAIILSLKSHKETILQSSREESFSQKLRNYQRDQQNTIYTVNDSININVNVVPSSKMGWKPIRVIGQGAIFTLADAAAMFMFWGSPIIFTGVTSIATGFGQIMDGIDSLREFRRNHREKY